MMHAKLLKHLRRHAQAWWYHAELREQGNHQEATRLERASIRDDVRSMRKALADPGAFISIGRGGVSLHYEHTQHSGFNLEHLGIAIPLLALGIPAYDSRFLSSEDIVGFALTCPIIKPNGSDDPAELHGWGRPSFNCARPWLREHGVAIIN